MTEHATRPPAPPIRWAETITPGPLRDPDTVMRLRRLGSLHPSRLSFVRSLVRLMGREQWTIACQRFDVGGNETGEAVYTVDTPAGRYSFVVFSQELDETHRSDRVIADRWDYTFALTEGEPDEADMARLRANVPKQEAGRVSTRELVLSRGNKSVRLFDYIVRELSDGRQPSADEIAKVGYLMRTTAVYGNGKFGLADYERLRTRTPFIQPFCAQMLTVYMARLFSLDLVDHLARLRGGDAATTLAPERRRTLGVGNATGLGMAPFIASHPALMNAWISARETALARVKGVESASRVRLSKFERLFERSILHVGQWQTGDDLQNAAIAVCRRELEELRGELFPASGDSLLAGLDPWQRLADMAAARFSLETQELLNSLMLEPYPDLVDDLEGAMAAEEERRVQAAMPLADFKALIESRYDWALNLDPDDPETAHFFWYRSTDKEEPRLGVRGSDPGDDREMGIGIGHAVAQLYREIANLDAAEMTQPVGGFVLRHPEHRALIARIQSLADKPYAEVRDNLLAENMRPVDLLRFKLSFFGAVRFDPKSDQWTRITLFSGAPLPTDFADPRIDCDDFFAPVLPREA